MDYIQPSPLASADAEYRFDRPKVYLTPLELARLTLLRSRLGGTRAERAAERIPAPRRRTVKSEPTCGCK